MGLVDAKGAAIFPNAELIVHEVEANFWLGREPAAGATERIRRNIGKARHATAPYRERMRTVPDGEALPGVSAVLLSGHTPGHTGWVVHSGRDSVLIWGDVVHIPAIQVARPRRRSNTTSTRRPRVRRANAPSTWFPQSGYASPVRISTFRASALSCGPARATGSNRTRNDVTPG